MYQITHTEPHALGLEKFTGSNRGLFYCNERERLVTAINEEGQEEELTLYEYDVYEVSDARFPDAVKDEVITQRYPRDEEHKILRKALSALIAELGMEGKEQFKEFMEYNEFVNSVSIK